MAEQHPVIKGAYKVGYKVDGKEVYVGTPPTACYMYPYYDSRRKTLEIGSYDFERNIRREFFVPLRDVVKAGAMADFYEACEFFNIPARDIEDILASAAS